MSSNFNSLIDAPEDFDDKSVKLIKIQQSKGDQLDCSSQEFDLDESYSDCNEVVINPINFVKNSKINFKEK